MRLALRTATALSIGAALTVCATLPLRADALAGGLGDPGDAFTTKTPYAPQGNPASYAQPPAGFTPVFTENVARHGTRTMSNSGDGDAVYALWQQAQAAGALTRRGEDLGPDVEALLAADAADGYGNLTSVGRQEMTGIADRMVRRMPHLLDGTHGSVGVMAEGKSARTIDSANDFTGELRADSPTLSIGALDTHEEDLLYFHKSNAAYLAYLKSPQVAAAEDQASDQPTTLRLATAALERSFTRSFVAGLSDDDVVSAAESLYALEQNVPDMGTETDVDLSPYMTAEQEAWFGYLDDVTSYYENGPGFAGSDVTYAMARPLLDDMFASLDAKVAGTSDLAAQLRFTHAEEIFPLSALLGIDGASEQLPAGTPYTYADSTFRGARVAPMAANIEWDLFSDGSRYLVRMLVNEKETAFKASCTPIKPGSYYYDLDELERCYGH